MEDFMKEPISGGTGPDRAEAFFDKITPLPDPWEDVAAPEFWEALEAKRETPRANPNREGTQRNPPAKTPPRQQGRRVRKKRRRRWSGLLGFLAGVTAASVVAAGVRFWNGRGHFRAGDRFSYDYREDYADEWGKAVDISIPTYPSGEGASFRLHAERGEPRTAQEVYRMVNPAVVTVLVNLGDTTAAVGTGVIFSGDGYFVTNYHVVEGGTDCTALLESGQRLTAYYVAGDEEHDLAVLKLEEMEGLPVAEFGDSDLLEVGDKAYAIGNPLGVEFRGTLTDGIISATSRNVEVDGRLMNLLQTNAALNSGNSGGPLINEYGQVVGINVVKMSSSRSTVEGLGFAIPSASMDRLVNDLLTYGKTLPEPVLGITVSERGEEVAEGVTGILVQSVTGGSPAAAAGVKEGDYVIAAGGVPVTSSRDLLRARGKCHYGDELALVLWRQGEALEVALYFPEV